MDVIGEEEKGAGLDREVNPDEGLPQSKNDEAKAIYKSFKYVALFSSLRCSPRYQVFPILRQCQTNRVEHSDMESANPANIRQSGKSIGK